MVNTSDESIVSWADDGTTFVVKDPETLTAKVIPQFFIFLKAANLENHPSAEKAVFRKALEALTIVLKKTCKLTWRNLRLLKHGATWTAHVLYRVASMTRIVRINS